jgi:hypothetical protein
MMHGRGESDSAKPFVPRQEISVFAGLRGGPGRIRTSSQTVMRRSAQTIELRARCARLEKLPQVVM